MSGLSTKVPGPSQYSEPIRPPFFKPKPGGSGIGLGLLGRQIAEAHGGELILKNRSECARLQGPTSTPPFLRPGPRLFRFRSSFSPLHGANGLPGIGHRIWLPIRSSIEDSLGVLRWPLALNVLDLNLENPTLHIRPLFENKRSRLSGDCRYPVEYQAIFPLFFER